MHQTYLKCNLLKCNQIISIAILLFLANNVLQLLYKLFVVINVPLIQTKTRGSSRLHISHVSFIFFSFCFVL